MTTIVQMTTTTTVFAMVKGDPFALPEEEKPILDQLFKFRHSLQQLRKTSHGNVTVSEMNVKVSELHTIVASLQQLRLENVERDDVVMLSCNRVDNVLDSIWMQIFYMWSKIANMDENLYPTYVSLVTLARSAEALRQSGAWTPEDVAPLAERMRAMDETIAATEGKFLPESMVGDSTHSLGDKIPMGQAVLTSLLNRVHRTITFMNYENDAEVDDLLPLKEELQSILRQLQQYQTKGANMYELTPLSKRLHAIDSSRGPTGKFNHTESEYGSATIAGILNQCFECLNLLVAQFDPVLPETPLYPTYRALLEIHSDLSRVAGNTSLRADPFQLSEALVAIQERLDILEKQRVEGSFVPAGCNAVDAVKLPGQAMLHKLLHDVHALVMQIVDPVSMPVGEALMSTYELLLKQRTALRKMRGWCNAGWDVRKELKLVEEALNSVDATRVNGLFVGASGQVAENADFPVLSDFVDSSGVPDGQSSVSALADECDTLLWQVKAMLSSQKE
ncbi:hypothetical protein BC830DRAFT_1166879 [Chytriomyces sp. MP71]|nr:hypothetical protein BC830DRAFT_1166879 [Chytriomyces sp. MP71]